MPTVLSSPSGSRFRVTRILGRGQFGTVYQVETTTASPTIPVGTAFALKSICCKGASERARTETKREVEILRLNSDKLTAHKNIIKYHDSWFRGPDLCILMEFAPNGTLEGYIRSNMSAGTPILEDEVTHFLKQLASALHHCHTYMCVIHRDLKPANILIDNMGHLKLGDFGISKRLGVDACCATQAGTPLYMPPEMLSGKTYTFSADIWMLGCVLHEIMIFHTPFAPPSVSLTSIPALFRRIQTQPVDTSLISQRYSTNLCRALCWMLSKKAENRPIASDVLALFVMHAPPANVAPELMQNAASSIQKAFRGSRKTAVGAPELPPVDAPVLAPTPNSAIPSDQADAVEATVIISERTKPPTTNIDMVYGVGAADVANVGVARNAPPRKIVPRRPPAAHPIHRHDPVAMPASYVENHDAVVAVKAIQGLFRRSRANMAHDADAPGHMDHMHMERVIGGGAVPADDAVAAGMYRDRSAVRNAKDVGNRNRLMRLAEPKGYPWDKPAGYPWDKPAGKPCGAPPLFRAQPRPHLPPSRFVPVPGQYGVPPNAKPCSSPRPAWV